MIDNIEKEFEIYNLIITNRRSNPFNYMNEKLRRKCYYEARYILNIFYEYRDILVKGGLTDIELVFEISEDYARAMTIGFKPTDLKSLHGVPVRVTSDKTKSVKLFITCKQFS